jgi:hypothetical protein
MNEPASPTMSQEQLTNLMQCLESVRKRPGMYFGKPDVEAAVHFPDRFQIAVWTAFGLDRDFHLRKELVESRGWNFGAGHPYHQMVDRGMSAQEVINELVAIEIGVLQRVKATTAQGASNEGRP